MNRLLGFALAVVLSAGAWASPQKLPSIPHLNAGVTQGQLANGLRYLIKPIQAPPGQSAEVELRLLVNSGSLGEAKDERGVAHLIEHMAFRRTANFTGAEIKALFSANGMRPGDDSNAYTSHQDTVYLLKLKRDDLARGLALLADWANGRVIFDPAELALERQVVLEEMAMRGRDNSNWRSFVSVMLPDSPYIENMPLGYEENVRDLSLERIESLYRKLYQPQKMTLIVAGDLPRDIEANIKHLFAAAPAGNEPVQYAVTPLTPKARTYRGNPWPQNELAVSWNFLQLPLQDARQIQMQKLALLALSLRLTQLGTQEKQAFSKVQMVDWTGMIWRGMYYTLYAPVKAQQPGTALTQLYREIRRAREFGITQAELDAALAAIEVQLKNWPTSNADWANNLLAAAKLGYPDLYAAEPKAILDPAKIKLEAVNQALREVLATPDQVAMLMGEPGVARFDLASWNDEKLAEMMATIDAEKITPPTVIAEKKLLPTEPARGKILTTRSEHGATVWGLSNGVQVLVRKQRQPNERIGINGRFPGGALALPKEQQFVSQLMANYMSASGLGEHTATELTYLLRNEDVLLQPMFETAQHGFGGVAAPRSVTTLFQLLYLGLAQPRSDDAAKARAAETAIQNYWPNGPGFLQNLYGSAWPYRAWGSLNDFEISTAQLDALRQQLYGHPEDLRVVITGVSDLAQIKDLVERYVASIPPADPALPKLRPSKIQPRESSWPTPLSERLRASLDKTPQFYSDAIQWATVLDDEPASTLNGFLQEGLNDVLKQRLFATLREKEGEIYSVNTAGEMSPFYGPTLSVEYRSTYDKCGPSILNTAQELQKLSRYSVTDTELKAMHEYMQKGLDNGPNYPFWYAYSQMFHWVNNQDLSWLTVTPSQLLTRARVDAAARKWYAPERWIVAANSCKTFPDLKVLDQPIAATTP
ncbi:M16 family metallopeptidase [Chitinibacter tainanensis]|uniref:M16 family metallopeptidase n=1 Tax=Chitinibacter tainanensis TaxID=230667 RepID=UPI002354AD07|nr:insulinase family protein [Chitinibacter tainanensis]